MISGMLSQEEIDALMSGTQQMPEEEKESDMRLNDIEVDAIGEIGNISMGTAATTLFTLLGQKVQITTPQVTHTTIGEIARSYPIPFIAVQVDYTIGVKGMNLLILREDDVKVITSLMLGGDGRSGVPEELNDIHLSAISESMNQMIGSSSTSLSEMLGKKIDISPPIVFRVSFSENELSPELIAKDETVVCISFRMTVGDLIDSRIMQILPLSFAKNLVDSMMNDNMSADFEEAEIAPAPEPKSKQISEMGDIQPETEKTIESEAKELTNQVVEEKYSDKSQSESYYEQPSRISSQHSVNVKPASFASLDHVSKQAKELPENIDLIKDVMLKVTVELGRTNKAIDDVLQFAPGSILELDRPVGEPLDILVNGKKIATGEVVVIDENYGIRITDIIKIDKRLKTI